MRQSMTRSHFITIKKNRMASRHGEAMPKSEQSELFVRREVCAALAQVELGAIITTKGSYETAFRIFIVFLLLLSACFGRNISYPVQKISSDINQREISDKRVKEINHKSRIYHDFLVGNLSYSDQDLDKAQKYFERVSQNSPVEIVEDKLLELYLLEGKI